MNVRLAYNIKIQVFNISNINLVSTLKYENVAIRILVLELVELVPTLL